MMTGNFCATVQVAKSENTYVCFPLPVANTLEEKTIAIS